MISKKMENMVANSSAIRAMFEEGNRLAKLYGKENVFDFSLGNPNVPAPGAVKQAILNILADEDPVALHGYTNSNAGYEDVRQAVAESLNERFGTAFSAKNITMSVGAAGGLNVILKSLLTPGMRSLYLPRISGNIGATRTTMTGYWWRFRRIRLIFSRSWMNLKQRSLQRQKP